jgi:hypothetical protein
LGYSTNTFRQLEIIPILVKIVKKDKKLVIISRTKIKFTVIDIFPNLSQHRKSIGKKTLQRQFFTNLLFTAAVPIVMIP